ncbi:MAG: 16S rRNA (cytosine1402-N4)-methyltransferase [Chlamydiales bacterium]|jgi:16S rRNA (cytosine1402-N4)-methyltransferase
MNKSEKSSPHVSVLLEEFLDFFEGKELKTFVDCTLGAGGHAKALLEKHPEIELFIGFDQDPLALEIAKENLLSFHHKTLLIRSNFSDILMHLTNKNISGVDGMFFDIGVSSMQLDQAQKGFSFMQDGPLDMRMDPRISLTAEEIVNKWSQSELATIIQEYGEERHWRAIAREIVSARRRKRITTTKELADIITTTVGGGAHQRIHPATRVFQALRIKVNDELGVLEATLPKAIDLLLPGGRLGVISFHSLEDRIVKQVFKNEASSKKNLIGAPDDLIKKESRVKILTKKPIYASQEEIRSNARSRSAKLRFIEKS